MTDETEFQRIRRELNDLAAERDAALKEVLALRRRRDENKNTKDLLEWVVWAIASRNLRCVRKDAGPYDGYYYEMTIGDIVTNGRDEVNAAKAMKRAYQSAVKNGAGGGI